MATSQTQMRLKPASGNAPQRNTRTNEIVAIALFAVSALLTLCLVSYHPSDASWNASGATTGAHNWIGAVGANVAAALYQTFGLAAILLPLLLVAASWRRFRTRRIHAPLSRIVGLVTLTLAAASLFALFITDPLFDKSFNAGGTLGVLFAVGLKSMLNTVGATVLLVALACVGVLLATNFSFARAYERLAAALSNPAGFFQRTFARFETWRAARKAQAQARAEMRREARAAREMEQQQALSAQVVAQDELDAREAKRSSLIVKRGADVEAVSAAIAAVKRNALATQGLNETPAREAELRAQLAEVEAAEISITPTLNKQRGATDGSGNASTSNGSKRVATTSPSITPQTVSGVKIDVETTNEVEEMLRDAAVVRAEFDDVVESPSGARADKSRRAEKSAIVAIPTDYKIPGNDFLNAAPPRKEQADEELLGIASQVAEKCKEFHVTGKIEHICPGPVVTTYEFKPDPGVKYSRVTGLVDDLCLALRAESIRIDRVPGKAHVGIEVPNPIRETIFLREVIESRQFRESPSKLTLALGKTIDGINYVADLTRMPHLLIAGATGTGKSVCLNSLVVSILYKASPEEVQFIMIDPKRLELGLYADIPHLATPIITEPKKAANALKWAVAQMEKRYKDLARWGVRNIEGYNVEVERRNDVLDFDDEGQPHKRLPYIVIIIDELADLMMTCGNDVEEAITRLAQMARAVGIHLVLATQRPSVDVITGLIKANFPSRIAFRVSSKVDSRTIIDANGAEQLLGRGDMLFLPPGTSRLVRVHGAFLDEAEVSKIVKFIKDQGAPVYDESITQSEEEAAGGDGGGGERDELFDQALRICCEMKRASTSVLQRRLRVGYGRAAAILDTMEREGFIGQADGARPRPVLQRAFETIGHWDELQESHVEDF